jgi:gas vesicle protein
VRNVQLEVSTFAEDSRLDMSNRRSGSFLGGLLLGTAIGAVTGLLLAPRTGRETRHLLKKSADALPDLAEDLSTTVQIQADRLSETALKNWDGTLGRLREAITAGLEATQREQESLLRESSGPPLSVPPPTRDSLR